MANKYKLLHHDYPSQQSKRMINRQCFTIPINLNYDKMERTDDLRPLVQKLTLMKSTQEHLMKFL